MVAKGWEMKALLMLTLMLLVAATALAYGRADVAAGVSTVAAYTPHASEPAALLLSGSALLGLAGALRRLVF